MSIINGDGGPVEQPKLIRIDPVRGRIVTRTWHCISEDQANAVIDQFLPFGASGSITEGVKWIVVIEYGADPESAEVPQDEYTLDSNIVAKDLLDADIPIVNSLNADNLEEFRKYTADPAAFELVGDFSGAATTGEDLESYLSANALWRLWLAGVRHVEIEQPVFRLSRFVSRDYNEFFPFSNVGKLMTTEQMKEDSLAPDDFLIQLDNISSQYTAPTRQDGLSVDYAWKKKAPRISGSGNKRRIDQEYVFGLWTTDLYQTAA